MLEIESNDLRALNCYLWIMNREKIGDDLATAARRWLQATSQPTSDKWVAYAVNLYYVGEKLFKSLTAALATIYVTLTPAAVANFLTQFAK